MRHDLLPGLQVGLLGARLPAGLPVGRGGDRALNDAALPSRPCLKGGLRLVYQMTLMTVGLYSEPTGAWLPSVAY